MEFEVNNEASVALKVLQFTESLIPSITRSLAYVKLMSKVLLRLGEFTQLRWMYSSMLGSMIEDEVKAEKAPLPELNPEDVAELWEDFYRIEATLGLATLSRLNEVRAKRNTARMLIQGEVKEVDGYNGDITEGVLSVLERFEHCNISSMQTIDGGIWNRCVGLVDDRETRPVRRADMNVRRSRKEEFFASDSLVHVSTAVKELAFNLPFLNTPVADVGVYLDQLRKLVLPARPEDEDDSNTSASSKRPRAEDDEEEGELAAADVEDIFKRRQRMRYEGMR